MGSLRQSTSHDHSGTARPSVRRAVTVPAPSATNTRRNKGRCRLCGLSALGDVLDAGGDVGVAHRACFVEWDRRQEALEQMLERSFGFAPPWDDLADRELETAPSSAPEAVDAPLAGRAAA